MMMGGGGGGGGAPGEENELSIGMKLARQRGRDKRQVARWLFHEQRERGVKGKLQIPRIQAPEKRQGKNSESRSQNIPWTANGTNRTERPDNGLASDAKDIGVVNPSRRVDLG
jgi:hypothetical protein